GHLGVVERHGLFPGGEQLPGPRRQVAGRQTLLVITIEPFRLWPVLAEHDHIGGGLPHLVVGGGEDLPKHRPGQGSAEGEVGGGGKTTLGFGAAEILHPPPQSAAQVLPEPVQQGGEVHRVQGGPVVVVAVRVAGGGVVAVHRPVGGQGGGEEH